MTKYSQWNTGGMSEIRQNIVSGIQGARQKYDKIWSEEYRGHVRNTTKYGQRNTGGMSEIPQNIVSGTQWACQKYDKI
jgi:hypothetical protein